MSGLGGFAIGAAPIFGGLLLGSQAGRTSTKAKADLRGVIKDEVQPKNAAAYLDRSRTDPGLLRNSEPAVHVFTDRGWRWGGYWRTPIDYQHFERP